MRHNEYARLIQKSKYNGHPQIDRMLAGKFARELLPSGFFSGIDLILPVPMHFGNRRCADSTRLPRLHVEYLR